MTTGSTWISKTPIRSWSVKRKPFSSHVCIFSPPWSRSCECCKLPLCAFSWLHSLFFAGFSRLISFSRILHGEIVAFYLPRRHVVCLSNTSREVCRHCYVELLEGCPRSLPGVGSLAHISGVLPLKLFDPWRTLNIGCWWVQKRSGKQSESDGSNESVNTGRVYGFIV